jgi:hypothetical protein
MQRTITALTMFVVFATTSMANIFMPDSMATDRDIINADSIENTSAVTAEIPDSTALFASNDTIDFDVPNYMLQEIDSMLNS